MNDWPCPCTTCEWCQIGRLVDRVDYLRAEWASSVRTIERDAVAKAMAALSKEVGNISLFSGNFYQLETEELVPIKRVKALIAEATP